MPPRRLDKSLADYLVIAVSPVLIMTLVGSLLFFLLTVFYHGQYTTRLHVVFALFVMATVLIARIAMREGSEYAALFGLPLALVTGLAMMKFVQIQGPLAGIGWLINWALLALVWWCAHRLTWDCTLLDERQDASGQGLLQRIGWDEPTARTADLEEPQDPPLPWWQCWREKNPRPHTPGLGVVYFSLAALPLFGIGQWFLPAGDGETRRYVFRLLGLYVASGLGLLLTTSFLGLRRYLRQRQLEMPPQMARIWLGVGTALVVLLMLFCALLPRPGTTPSLAQSPLQFSSPSDLTPSPDGVGRDGPVSEHGDEPGSSGQSPSQPEGPGESSQASSGDPRGGDDTQAANQPAPHGQASGGSPGHDASENAASQSQADTSDRGESARSTHPPDDQSAQSDSGDQAAPSSPPESSFGRPGQLLSGLTSALVQLIRIAFYLALVAAACWLLWRYRAEARVMIERLLQRLRELWARWFGSPRAVAAEAGDAEQSEPRARPFAEFADPFVTGMAQRAGPEEVIKYSFQALEAWAHEHGCARQAEQTPHEFAQQLVAQQASLEPHVRRLAELYSRVAYAEGSLPRSSIAHLQPLWQQLRPTAVARR